MTEEQHQDHIKRHNAACGTSHNPTGKSQCSNNNNLSQHANETCHNQTTSPAMSSSVPNTVESTAPAPSTFLSVPSSSNAPPIVTSNTSSIHQIAFQQHQLHPYKCLI